MNGNIRHIVKLETLFSINHYCGSSQKDYIIEKGTIPIIISAPHATKHFREKKLKAADAYTGAIARYLHEQTHCHVIYTSRCNATDPNYAPSKQTSYKRALKKYVQEHGIRFLIDLHGCSAKYSFAVDMGTAPRFSSRADGNKEKDPSLHKYKFIAGIIRNELEKEFSKSSFRQKSVGKNRVFTAGRQNTITRYISRNTDTACIQLEINELYRTPENEKEFMQLVNGLCRIIRRLRKIEW